MKLSGEAKRLVLEKNLGFSWFDGTYWKIKVDERLRRRVNRELLRSGTQSSSLSSIPTRLIVLFIILTAVIIRSDVIEKYIQKRNEMKLSLEEEFLIKEEKMELSERELNGNFQFPRYQNLIISLSHEIFRTLVDPFQKLFISNWSSERVQSWKERKKKPDLYYYFFKGIVIVTDKFLFDK